MIKANELRIGSYVHEDVLGIVPIRELRNITCWVTAINLTSDKKVNEQYYHVNYESLEPIPLTPELFKQCELNKLFERDIAWHITYKRYIYRGCNPIVDLDYLHQLQNLHFAITNEELKITL